MTGKSRSVGVKQPGRRIQSWSDFERQQRGGSGQVEVDPFPPLINSSSEKASDRILLKQNMVASDTVKHGDISFMCVSREEIDKFSNSKKITGRNSASCNLSANSFMTPPASSSWDSVASSKNFSAVHVDSKKQMIEKLKVLYSWAGESLIQDILSAVGNDLQKACISLDSMSVCSQSSPPLDSDKTKEYKVSETDPTSLVPILGFDNLSLEDSEVCIPYPPSEPEFEEDDIYLKNRKEALRMSRASKQHSKKALQAYERGDHHTARLMSLKSQELHSAAEKLNYKAAEEILKIRNAKNGPWKLDLHGLHASEAVKALANRLEMIEYGDFKAPSSSCLYKSNGHSLIQPTWKPFELQVVTGSGTHSPSGASLPSAVKGFLMEKGYKFGEGRPGVISVRPKFRYNRG